jgi:hypothetical protein
MSILIPALSQVKKAASRIKCGSNVRQQLIALTGYAGDNNDYLPEISAGYWMWDIPFTVTDRIHKYLGKSREVYYCPSNRLISTKRTGIWYWSLGVGEFAPEQECKEKDRNLTAAERALHHRIIGYTWLLKRGGSSYTDWKPILRHEPKKKYGDWPVRLSDKMGHRVHSEVELIVDTIISYGDNARDPHQAVMKCPGGTHDRWGWSSPSNHLYNDKVQGGNTGYCDGSVKWKKFDKMTWRNDSISNIPVFWW